MAAKIEATEMLRPGLLAGVSLVVARAPCAATQPGSEPASTVAGACMTLGANVFECGLAASGSIEADDAATAENVAAALAELGEVDLLLVDAASAFAPTHSADSADDADGAGSGGSPSAGTGTVVLMRALEASWRVTQVVANAAFIERGAAGRIVYVAPPPDAGSHAEAARAGLENLARTLSIEWARYGIAPVTIAAGAQTSAGEIAALTAYLASPAGAYFSGCLLDLRGASVRASTPGQ